ncbi:hypothetical protein AVEN_210877-1 [Araneus ventricosus]|uniref:Uncharacterized protein n=1 Tax=Araneus ventricosus TaxID=182803 RepID=A0A4Y2QUX0_ARAVE|nr:hypothetical protein AVEN_73419-1 [Araneus ventricosus]GBN67178.1 hypothetical protein AVEN_43537-1 [Araneus ventricosus]GBN67182.1 hypothetical protein AVEN_210877-1 [Araneus ventricosus]
MKNQVRHNMWATSRVPVGGAAIASDVRVSSCREQKRRRRGTRRMNDSGRVHVGGAAIANDVRVSRCREQ